MLGDVKRARGSRPQVANCCSAGAVGGRIGMVSFLMFLKSRILGDVPVGLCLSRLLILELCGFATLSNHNVPLPVCIS